MLPPPLEYLRHILLIHGYFGVDYDIVWNVATEKAQELRSAIEEIIERESAARDNG